MSPAPARKRAERKRPANTSPLSPTPEPLRVGDAAPAAAPASKPEQARTAVPFSSYLEPGVLRDFKVRCILNGIEMREGVDQAIREWLAKNS